jgi:hypothetical protein
MWAALTLAGTLIGYDPGGPDEKMLPGFLGQIPDGAFLAQGSHVAVSAKVGAA